MITVSTPTNTTAGPPASWKPDSAHEDRDRPRLKRSRLMEFDQTQLKDTIGNFRTMSLFFETNNTNYEALYSLKDYDHEVDGKMYPSLKKIYLQFEDPTEWEFVEAVFGNWRHWERICNNKLIFPYIEQWRKELEIKLRSKAIRDIVKLSKTKDSAAKWVAEGNWKGKKTGRPTKEVQERELNISKEIHEQWERLSKELEQNETTTKPN
jgi:hypothetical protein